MTPSKTGRLAIDDDRTVSCVLRAALKSYRAQKAEFETLILMREKDPLMERPRLRNGRRKIRVIRDNVLMHIEPWLVQPAIKGLKNRRRSVFVRRRIHCDAKAQIWSSRNG